MDKAYTVDLFNVVKSTDETTPPYQIVRIFTDNDYNDHERYRIEIRNVKGECIARAGVKYVADKAIERRWPITQASAHTLVSILKQAGVTILLPDPKLLESPKEVTYNGFSDWAETCLRELGKKVDIVRVYMGDDFAVISAISKNQCKKAKKALLKRQSTAPYKFKLSSIDVHRITMVEDS